MRQLTGTSSAGALTGWADADADARKAADDVFDASDDEGAVLPNGWYGGAPLSIQEFEGTDDRLDLSTTLGASGPDPVFDPAAGYTQPGSALSADVDAYAGNASTTGVLGVGSSVSSAVDFLGDRDWFKISLQAGQSYLFTQNGQGGGGLVDSFLRLYDANSALLTYNDDGGPGTNAELRFTPTVSGDYFISAGAWDDDGTGTYLLSAAAVAPQDPLATIDWGLQISTSTVTVYFALAGQTWDGFSSARAWTSGEKAAAMQAWSTISAVCNLTFVETNDSSSAFIVAVLDTNQDFLGLATGIGGEASLIFNIDAPYWGPGPLQVGGTAQVTLIHEMEHALGFAHPHDDGGNSEVMEGVVEPFGSYGSALLNQGVYTVMSYNDGWPTGGYNNPSYSSGYAETPMALDVALLQAKYGAVASHVGDDVYTLGVGAAAAGFSSLWDTGGSDTIAYLGASACLIDLRAATLTNQPGGGGYVSYAGLASAGFTIAAGVVIENASGGSGFDLLIGNTAANILSGGGGADTLNGGAGADTLIGGTGSDIYVVDNLGDVVAELSGEGTDTVQTDQGSRVDYLALYVLPTNVENLIGTSPGAQGVQANSGDNVVTMGAGGDLLVMADGGADTVNAGGGNDYIYFGGALASGDFVDGEAGQDTLGLIGSTTITFGASSLANVERLAVYGAAFLGGGAFDYSITTVDTNIGAEGLFVTAASLQSNEHLTFDASAESSGAITIHGGQGDDVISTGDGADFIIGNAGADTLTGNGGADILQGGNGADTFIYRAVSDSTPATMDSILDFATGDHIDLSAIDTFSFIGSSAFSQVAGELRAINASGSSWLVEADVNGDGVADLVILVGVSDGQPLGLGSFVL